MVDVFKDSNKENKPYIQNDVYLRRSVVLLSSSLAFNIFPKLIRFFIEKLENWFVCKEKMLEKQILFSSNTLTTLIRCLF